MKPTVGLIFVSMAAFAVHDVSSIGIISPVVSAPESVWTSFCPKICPAIVSPVFDENGIMYGNKCKMQAAKCKQKTTASKPAEDTASKSGGGSTPINSFCPDVCPAVISPVFDENGVMYTNACKMRAAKCKQKKNNANVDNDGDGSSATKRTKVPKKKCADTCPDVALPVCGSNGVKYSSPCELKVAACKNPELNIVEDEEACTGSQETTAQKSIKTSKTACSSLLYNRKS
ncbi:hypothetical protein ON010_g12903 [Phytophthora cinnamomi]|nr:hypothetical protein ON010_g12903 [Phytophthora cinnamomi]